MLQTPSRRVLWKITSTARKSMNEIRNAPPRSSVNDMRYWRRDRVEPRREERQRKHHSREEERHGKRERRHSPDVGDPERGRVVEEAESEADDDGECDTQYERERVERRGVVEAEEKAADQERE